MKAFVITIIGLHESEQAAQRCIESGERFGIEIKEFEATTPKDDPEFLFEEFGYPSETFQDNKWSHKLPTMAAFLSHSRLWHFAEAQTEMVLILEHDAVIVDSLPNFYPKEKIVCNVAKPSFGRYRTPQKGFRLFSSNPHPKGYFKGLHGYLVSPAGASALLDRAHEAEPADLYVNKVRFPWLTEWYPWPVEANDHFSTIQRELGCRAKHNKVRPI